MSTSKPATVAAFALYALVVVYWSSHIIRACARGDFPAQHNEQERRS